MIKTTKVTYRIGEKGAVVNRPVINQKDVDTNRIEFSVFDGTLPYELESTGLGVTFYFVTRDGQYMGLTADSIIDNKAYVDVPDEIVLLVGQIDIEVEITDGSRVLNVTGFALSIEPSKRLEEGVFVPPENFQLSWQDVLGKPTTYPPSGHGHNYDEILELWKLLRDEGRIIDVTKYGAVGDGVTDDSEALKLAVEAVKSFGGYACLYFPPRVYIHGDGIADPINGTGNSWQPDPNNPTHPLLGPSEVGVGRDIRLIFEDFDGLTIWGYGATIRSHPNNGECRNNIIFDFVDCNDLKFLGLTLDGNKQARQPQFLDVFGSARGNLQLQARRNVLFQDASSNGSLMDGFYLAGINGGETLKGLRVINCNADDAYRNCMTISNALLPIVEGGRYTNAGLNYGTLPMGGIDIEADWETTINQGAIIRGVYFTGNEVMGLAISFRSHNTKVEDCIFDNENNSIYFIDVEGAQSGAIIERNLFINSEISTIPNSCKFLDNRVILKPTSFSGGEAEAYFLYLFNNQTHDGDYLEFRGNRFEVDMSGVSTGTSFINVGRFYFNGRENVIFENNTVVNMMSYGAFSGYMFDVSGTDNNDLSIKNNRFILEDKRWVSTMGDALFPPLEPDKLLGRISGNEFVGYRHELTTRVSDGRFESLGAGQYVRQSKILENGQLYKINPFSLAKQKGGNTAHAVLRFYAYGSLVEMKVTQDTQFDPTSESYELKHYIGGATTSTIPDWLDVWVKDEDIYFKTSTWFVTVDYETVITGGAGANLQEVNSNRHVVEEAVEGSEVGGTQPLYTTHSIQCATLAEHDGKEIPIGFSTFVVSLGKPAWWNGVDWVDSTGAVIN